MNSSTINIIENWSDHGFSILYPSARMDIAWILKAIGRVQQEAAKMPLQADSGAFSRENITSNSLDEAIRRGDQVVTVKLLREFISIN